MKVDAVAEFHKWEAEKYGDKTPLADIHVDLWIEAFTLGFNRGVELNNQGWDELMRQIVNERCTK